MKHHFLAAALVVGMCGCASVKEFFTTAPDQGVVVTNTIPDSYAFVIKRGVGGEAQVFGKLKVGMDCFVPASYYPDSQTFAVIVHVYTMDGGHIGSRTRLFSFSNPRGRSYRNEVWDVRKSDLLKGD
ncbi:MAG: hypothetical protein HYU81_01835 [Candidatus Brennerbacteria bacterium]|nr:hypothetical protein [Candidatus Brennerbacteria bacterium]